MFTKYGFEDKDLLLRLINEERIFSFAPEAIVIHTDRLTIKSICNKMYDAGKYSSYVFQGRHPEYYRNTACYRADISNYNNNI